MKKTILTTIQIAIAAALLWWVLGDKIPDIQKAFAKAKISWIVWGFLAFGILVLTGIVRWNILLRAQNIHLSYKRTSGLFLIGFFFNQFIPGSTGGDLFKIYYVVKETHTRKTAAFLSVLVDRIMGMFGVMIVALLMVALNYNWLVELTGPLTPATILAEIQDWFATVFAGKVPDFTPLLAVSMILFFLIGATCGIIVAFIFSVKGWMKFLPQWIPLREKFLELSEAFIIYGKAWRHTLAALACSIGGHLGISLSCYFCSKAYVGLSLAKAFTLMPIINVATTLPITPGGAGVRETFFQSLYSPAIDPLLPGGLGEAEPTAIAISLTTYGVMLAWGVVGGIVYPFYRSTSHEDLKH